MALFPQSFLDDLKAQTNIVSVIGDVVPLKKAGATGRASARSIRKERRRSTSSETRAFSSASAAAPAATSSSSSSCTRRSSFPEAVRYLAQRAGMPVPETQGGPDERAAAAEREALVKLHEEAAAFFREQLTTPAGARARRELEIRGLTAETIRSFRLRLCAGRPGARHCAGRFADRKVPVALQLKSGLVVEREGGRAGRPVPEPPDDPDRARFGRDRGVWRPGARRGTGPEVPEFAGNADLHEGPDAVRAGRDEGGHPEAQLLRAGRGVFRPRAGLAGRRPAGGGLVRDGADERAGAGAETVHVQGRPEFRSGCGRPGGGGAVVGTAGGGGISGQRRAAARGQRPGYVHPAVTAAGPTWSG